MYDQHVPGPECQGWTVPLSCGRLQHDHHQKRTKKGSERNIRGYIVKLYRALIKNEWEEKLNVCRGLHIYLLRVRLSCCTSVSKTASASARQIGLTRRLFPGLIARMMPPSAFSSLFSCWRRWSGNWTALDAECFGQNLFVQLYKIDIGSKTDGGGDLAHVTWTLIHCCSRRTEARATGLGHRPVTLLRSAPTYLPPTLQPCSRHLIGWWDTISRRGSIYRTALKCNITPSISSIWQWRFTEGERKLYCSTRLNR